MRHFIIIIIALITSPVFAHDTWVQTNTNLIRTGDAVHVDLMLGNHGNEHRDFKLASKTTLDGVTLKVHGPTQQTYDIAGKLIDVGYTPKEGFWSAKFAATEPGLYVVEHKLDRVVNHGQPVRSVKSAKTFFVVSKSLDNVPQEHPGFDRVLGHALELVPEANTVTPMGPDVPIRVRVLFRGEPLAGARVSFIPRGTTLADGFDPEYERTTNDHGRAMFIPKEGNHYLVVVHHKTDESAADYVSTSYSATLTVFVPDVCPCCGE
ncbi:MAG: DUF4198 domain-containing protein [Planctomycetaceae bacterium]|nr:DUF4198 domain-containing protein [Planctomycetaceae bacterium]